MTDLKLNYPTIEIEARAYENFIISRKLNFKDFLEFPAYQGEGESLEIASKWLNINHLISLGITSIIECNSANHSLSSLLQTLKENHQSIIAEPFTYPAFKSIALNFGFKLYSSDFDNEGLTLEGLEKTFKKTKSNIIYLQPTIHNPTCVVMSINRRKLISEFVRRNNILVIEDDAYRFLHPNPPLRFLDLIPENTFHIFSLSKPFNSFLKTSYLISPNSYANSIIDNVRLNSSGHSSLLSSLASYILCNNVLETIIFEKQNTAVHLQKRLLPLLDGISYNTFPTSYHVWLQLPSQVKSNSLVKESLERNIIIPGCEDFLTDNLSPRKDYIRIAFGAEKNIDKIESALIEIVNLINDA